MTSGIPAISSEIVPPAHSQHGFSLVENLVADLLRELFLHPSEVELTAIAAAQNALGTATVATVGGGGGSTLELAHQRVLDRSRLVAAEIIVLDAELQQARDVAGAARGDGWPGQCPTQATEIPESTGRCAAFLLLEQISKLRVRGRDGQQSGDRHPCDRDPTAAYVHVRTPLIGCGRVHRFMVVHCWRTANRSWALTILKAGTIFLLRRGQLSICPEISCTSSNRWPDGVVPFTMKLGAFYVNFIEFIISHVYAFRVGVGIHLRLNF